MSNNFKQELFPALPLEEWEDTKNTLHLFLQIVGKIRLKTFPKKNHWWHVPFYVSTRGLTTGPIPYKGILFEIAFNFIDHVLQITSSDGSARDLALVDKLSVSEFYQWLFSNLSELGIDVTIKAIPYDVPASTEPFETDTQHASYDKEYVNRFWRILVQVDSIFQEFRGRFIGKSTPVHLFWHHMDLALTWFSGRPAPEREGVHSVEREAYSHEVISFGFWVGDENVREPAFYSYTFPQPEGLMEEPLHLKDAFWNPEAGMALLMYNAVRKTASPKQAVLDFLESAYQAGARKANWDVSAFQLTP